MSQIYALQAPSLMRFPRMIDIHLGGTAPVRLGRLLAVPGLDDATDETIAKHFQSRKRAWIGRSPPRYVTVDMDLTVVYSWPMQWFHCREPALGKFVRRVGRLEDNHLILDGHHFLAHLGV